MPTCYETMDDAALARETERLQADVDALAAQGLTLDMARGKPSPAQVDLSRPVLDVLTSESSLTDDGVDAANYGAPDGLPSARRLMAEVLEVDPAHVIVAGSSSLNLMYDLVGHAFTRGVRGATPWSELGEVKFLCPAPGYDRHFAVTEHFGVTNVPVPMTETGPDMDLVERLVETDPTVKGIWCVPKYQNPTGVTFSDETVRRFAGLRPAAEDFRIYWDNAYVVHGLYDQDDELLNIFDVLAETGREDLVYEFASTSKVTFPGSGIACVAASPKDLDDIRLSSNIQRVCSDKITQLMHVRYFSGREAVVDHMALMAEVLRPKFELVEQKLTDGLAGLDVATWTNPRGGYFVSFDGPDGSAKRIVAMCREVGVTLTGAGATWPYGDDPRDSNIRIAPSYPTLEELGQALDVLVACTKLVAGQLAAEARA
ncbi:aminotransferase class I/II-fold pyridoxal phosphate-dependent enzyme [Olsenella sp. YH-ols2217]|uniref:Aminotransferase class I/II-fold pyridoxal phosphate-dependent enzyme n=1 Tax=Kribbibacterium absianum TaxID=3044210 RepID=A0ABT6ZK69_9ACTN|nr:MULTISPECIES: aminotransferase class I/II-fold pyridoxal phosphate-dependent enzyme [unclassified Olsenella]MDJ1122587.1 aminotransferase class I/II-fold pyridoxal phosphate-dependent enzyme [Olsenella sp. YH-ols2216]MDJ1129453.1 aminotransferase class I/II-fold pyridoxal phosphate-dependent enzyme [Olsenella sp. YH-ols2217]